MNLPPNQIEYDEAKDSVQQKLDEISSYFDLNIGEIKWNHFRDLLIHKYDVQIVPFVFTGKLSKIFAGSLYFDNGEALIGYNDSLEQSENRKHFTIMHEGIHYFDDAKNGTNKESFSDLLDNKNYSDTELIREQHADYSASLLMCNDIAFESSMKQGLDHSQMEREFQMTPAAIWVRVLNFLMFNLSMTQTAAVYLANTYSKGDSKERRSFLPFFITNKSLIKVWGYDEYRTNDSLQELYNELGYDGKIPNSYWYQLQHLFGSPNKADFYDMSDFPF